MAKHKTLGEYLPFGVPMVHFDDLKEKMQTYQKMGKDELIALLLQQDYDKMVNF